MDKRNENRGKKYTIAFLFSERLKKPEACTDEDQFNILKLGTREFYEI
jgi:hypothetical protein